MWCLQTVTGAFPCDLHEIEDVYMYVFKMFLSHGRGDPYLNHKAPKAGPEWTTYLLLDIKSGCAHSVFVDSGKCAELRVIVFGITLGTSFSHIFGKCWHQVTSGQITRALQTFLGWVTWLDPVAWGELGSKFSQSVQCGFPKGYAENDSAASTHRCFSVIDKKSSGHDQTWCPGINMRSARPRPTFLLGGGLCSLSRSTARQAAVVSRPLLSGDCCQAWPRTRPINDIEYIWGNVLVCDQLSKTSGHYTVFQLQLFHKDVLS